MWQINLCLGATSDGRFYKCQLQKSKLFPAHLRGISWCVLVQCFSGEEQCHIVGRVSPGLENRLSKDIIGFWLYHCPRTKRSPKGRLKKALGSLEALSSSPQSPCSASVLSLRSLRWWPKAARGCEASWVHVRTEPQPMGHEKGETIPALLPALAVI